MDRSQPISRRVAEPVWLSHPALCGSFMELITSAPSFAAHHRNAFLGLIPHLRNPDIVARMITLDRDELTDLCEVVLAGLEEARKGPPKTLSSNSAGSVVLRKLGIYGTANTQILAVASKFSRPGNDPFPDGIRERHRQRCAITYGTIGASACHIIPHASAAVSHPYSSCYWGAIGVLFGAAVFDELWDMVGGRKAASLYNGLLLNQESHTLWDECSVNFSLTSTPDLTTSIIYVKLLGEPSETQKWMTFVPPFLDHQSDSPNSELHVPRPILHGDEMRIWTTNPVTHPLPDDFLMNIREILNHAVVTCGVSETLKARLARAKAVEEPRRREAKKRNRDDDDDDGEDAETRPSTANDGGDVNQLAEKKRRGHTARRGKSGNGGGEKGGTTPRNIKMANVEDRFLIPPSENELLRVFGPQRELELVDAYGDEDADVRLQQNE